jgi:hypothetical protein
MSPDPAANPLYQLLGPVAPESFFERYWAREYLYVGRSSDGYFSNILTAEDLDVFLRSEQLPASFVNVFLNGVACPVEEWSRVDTAARGIERVAISERLFGLYLDGATIILNQTHHALPGIAATCRMLAHELRFPVQCNIYVTPPSSQGFHPHTDPHEILILQITGSKSFLLYPPDGSTSEIEMMPGDTLYIPRGLRHEARTSGKPSIHLSIGMKPGYAFDLLSELAAFARELPAFQSPIPHLALGAATREGFEEEFLRNLTALLSTATVSAMIDRRYRKLVDSQVRGWPGRFTDILRYAELKADSTVCARKDIVYAIAEKGKDLQVEFSGRRVGVPWYLKSCLPRILDGSPFVIADLKGMLSADGKVEFIKSFVRAGLMSILKI